MIVLVNHIALRLGENVWVSFQYGEGGDGRTFSLPMLREEAAPLKAGYWYEIDFTPIPDPTEQ